MKGNTKIINVSMNYYIYIYIYIYIYKIDDVYSIDKLFFYGLKKKIFKKI